MVEDACQSGNADRLSGEKAYANWFRDDPVWRHDGPMAMAEKPDGKDPRTIGKKPIWQWRLVAGEGLASGDLSRCYEIYELMVSPMLRCCDHPSTARKSHLGATSLVLTACFKNGSVDSSCHPSGKPLFLCAALIGTTEVALSKQRLEE
jgi:hypothetical protein